MTNLDLHEAMLTLAEDAPVPPPDLLDRVVAGHRRRRRTRAMTAAFAAVLLVAAGVWLWRPPAEQGLPADGFRLPPLPATVPSVSEAWPAAVITEQPPATPDNIEPVVLGLLDRTHLLVGDHAPDTSRSTMWSYSIIDRTFRPVLRNLTSAVGDEQVAVTARSIVRLVVDGGRVEVWVSAHDGGSDHRIASVPVAPGKWGGLYADNGDAYFSMGTGVLRVSLVDGTVERYPGFEGLETDGSPWASDPTSTTFRHLVTGKEIRAVLPKGAGEVQCIPVFCLYSTDGRWFLQWPDGSGTTALPYSGHMTMVGALTAGPGSSARDSGLLAIAPDTLLDPVRGILGSVPGAESCRLAAGYGQLKSGVRVSWSNGGKAPDCTPGFHFAYIGAAD